MFSNWISAYTQLFQQAQAKGQVRSDVQAVEIARFLVAALEGSIGVSKAEQSSEQWQACQLYLKGLKMAN